MIDERVCKIARLRIVFPERFDQTAACTFELYDKLQSKQFREQNICERSVNLTRQLGLVLVSRAAKAFAFLRVMFRRRISWRSLKQWLCRWPLHKASPCRPVAADECVSTDDLVEAVVAGDAIQ